MELSHAYATEDDLREQLGDGQGRLADTMLKRALNAASRAIDNHTRDQFYADDTPTLRRFEADNCRQLLLKPSIATTTGLVIASEGANWATADYRLQPLDKASGWSAIGIDPVTGGRRFRLGYIVDVTARWGWLTVPPEVEQACLLKATTLFSRKDAPFGVATFGDFAAVRITRQDPEVLELLSTYVLDVGMVG